MATSTPILAATRPMPVSFGRLLGFFFIITIMPYLWSLTQVMAYRGIYTTAVTIFNLTGFAAFLMQYPFSGRISRVTHFSGIDNTMRLHRKAGEIIAIYFFLHPFLTVLPRYFIAPSLSFSDLWTTFTAPESVTGVYAWTIMSIWVLMAVFKERLGISYEVWRISHGLGFVAVAILATLHAITVGRHGQYSLWFQGMWIVLCGVAVSIISYTYFVRPFLQKKKPFKLVDIVKLGSRDWNLTIEKDGDFEFEFEAGQFLWINTSGNPFKRCEHPFSIASCPSSLPRLSFIIRELGDYTSRLDQLKPGQRVYVDGPHGVFTLEGQNAAGVALIAGGAGIGPTLGILRQLRDLGESRSIRLIYGNRCFEQMVFLDEIEMTEKALPDFKKTLVLEQAFRRPVWR